MYGWKAPDEWANTAKDLRGAHMTASVFMRDVHVFAQALASRMTNIMINLPQTV